MLRIKMHMTETWLAARQSKGYNSVYAFYYLLNHLPHLDEFCIEKSKLFNFGHIWQLFCVPKFRNFMVSKEISYHFCMS